ncbi:EthD domain-containing protein, partial [Thermodesulfobacteriota bacterium]
FLKKKEGLASEEFSRQWFEKIGPLAASTMPGFRRYVQNHAVTLPGATGEPRIDGVTEIWFDDMEALQKFFKVALSDEGEQLRTEEDKIFDAENIFFFIAEEKVIVP